MAAKIGVVLALDGESKFTQGMRSAKTSAKNCKDELKRLSTEMKGSANTAENLKKKQEALKKAQEGYQRVLTAAKTGQANAKKAFQEQASALEKLSKEYEDAKKAVEQYEKAGKTNTEEYRAAKKQAESLGKAVEQQATNYLKAEQRLSAWDGKVAQAESDLRGVDAELQKNNQYLEEASKAADGCATSIDKMGDEVSDTKDELGEGNKSLKDFLMYTAGNLTADAIKKVGDAAVKAAKYVIEVGSKFEASMSKVAALSGASSTELKAMEDVAKELGSTTMFSASEVADGFSYMALAGWNAQQSIDAMPGILSLAAASQMDLATASDMVTDYLSAFGMEASDATKMADMLAFAQANSNTSTQQLGDAFGNCAANMHAAGQDMETTTSFLEAFANQGIKGSEAGTKLSAIMRDITAKMKDGKIQIGDTAVAVQDSNGNFRDLTDIMIDVEAATDGMGDAERAAALSATFTSKSVGGLNMILAEGMGKISGYEKDLRNCDGAASDMAKTMQNNLAGKVTEFNSALEGLGIQLYSYFSGPLQSVVALATDLISGITALITPQRTELETFIDDIDASNEAVKKSIEAAGMTVANGQQKAAEIALVGEEIKGVMDSCEQFNMITLDDGTKQIVDAAGNVVIEFNEMTGVIKNADGEIQNFGESGLSIDQIVKDALTAQGAIGYITQDVSTVEDQLDHFAENGINTQGLEEGKKAIIQIFDEAGEEVATFQTQISETGEIDTTNIELGTQAIVKYFDDTTGEIKEFKTQVGESGNVNIETAQIAAGTDTIVELYNDAGEKVGEFKTTVIDTGNIQIPVGASSGIKAGLDTIVQYYDDVSGKVVSVNGTIKDTGEIEVDGENIKKGTSVIVDAYDAAGEKVGTFNATVDETGKITLPTEGSGIQLGMDAYVTCVDGATQSLQTFQTTVNDLNLDGFDTTNASQQYDQLTGAVKKTYTITDDFTKMKMDRYVQQFGGSVRGLKEAWDENTGSLTASKDELEKWFSVAQQVAMYDAYKDAAAELYTAYADAWVNITKSQSAENELLRQFNEQAGTTYKNYDEYVQGCSEGTVLLTEDTRELGGALQAQHEKTQEYVGTMEDAKEAIDTTGKALEDAADALDGMGVEIDDATGEIVSADNAASEAGQSFVDMGEDADDASGNVETLEKTLDKLGLSAEKVSEKMEKARDAASKAVTDMVEDALDAAKKAFSINPFEGWKVDEEHGMASFADAMESQIASMQNYAANLQTVSQHVGQEITPEFLQYLQDMGEDGAKLLQDIAREFEEGGDPSAVEAIVQQYMDALDAQEQIAQISAANALAIKLGLKELGSTDEEWADLKEGVKTGLDSWGSELDQGLKDSLNTAIETAEQMGIKIPDELAETMKSGSQAPQQTLEAMIDIMQSAIEGHQDGVIAAAKKCGIAIPDELIAGIDAGGPEAEAAWKQIVELINGAEIDTEGIKQTGTETTESFAEGVAEGQSEAETAAQNVAEAAHAATLTAIDKFSTAGTLAGGAFKIALANRANDATASGNTLATAGSTAAGNHTSEYESAGSSSASSFKSGLDSVDTTSSGNSLSSNALNGASGYYQSFYSVGSNLGSGLHEGLKSWAGTVAQTAANMVSNAVAEAKVAGGIQSPSKVFRDQVGKMIGAGLAMGIEQSTGLATSAAEAQMNQTLYAMQKWLSGNISKIRATGTSYADAVSYTWKQIAKQQIASNFGIEDTKKSGDDTVKKTAEEMSSDVLKAARKYLENVKVMYNVSAEEAERYWRTVRKQLTEGTQAWFDATSEIKKAREQQVEDAKQANSEILNNAEKYMEHLQITQNVSLQDQLVYWTQVRRQLKQGSDEWYEATKKIKEIRSEIKQTWRDDYAKILSDAQEYVDERKRQNKMSVQDEIDYWTEVLKQLKRGTAEYKEARQQLADAKAQVGTVNTASDLLDTYQTYYDMSARAEMQYWDIVRKRYKAGTAERVQADKQYLQARKNYYDTLNKLDEEYEKSKKDLEASRDEEILKLRQDLAKQTAQIEQNRDKQIESSQKQLVSRLKTINEDLKKNIQSVSKQLQSDLDATRQKYYDAVESRRKEIMSSYDLFSEFTSESQTGEQLLFNLQSQAAGYKDWQKSVAQLQKRGILSGALMDEILEKGPQDSAAVHALLSLTDAQLKQYNEAYEQKLAISEQQAKKENRELLVETVAAVKQLKEDAKAEIKELREQAKTDRATARKETRDEIQGFRKAASDQIAELKKSTASEIAKVRSNTKEQLASLKSTYVTERKNLTQAISSDLLTLAKNIRSIASDQTAALASAFTSAVGLLAGAESSVGKNVKPSVTTAAGIKTAKKNAIGNKQLKDFFAWMDELGIGSEMIIRKSDGARLNYNVRPGDAIVPAKNTSILWKWSEIDPEMLINGLKAQQASLNQYISTVMSGVASLASLNAQVLSSGTPSSGRGDAATQMMAQIFALMQEYMPYMAEQKTISVDGRELAEATTGYISNELAMRSRRQR